jgi:hypothetical protein
MDISAPIDVVAVSSEGADDGVIELNQNGRLLASTYEHDTQIILRFEPARDGAAIEVGAHALLVALAEARERLSAF